jgi:hypothetical protein
MPEIFRGILELVSLIIKARRNIMNKTLQEIKEFIMAAKKVQAKSPLGGKNLDVIVVPDNFSQVQEIIGLDKNIKYLINIDKNIEQGLITATDELAEKENYQIYLVSQSVFESLDVPWTAVWNVLTGTEVSHV